LDVKESSLRIKLGDSCGPTPAIPIPGDCTGSGFRGIAVAERRL
jgi:hypothetical protein